MPSGQPVTIHDVAREAGVSVATVSRVLNDSRPVDAILRDRVQSTVARLGYRPSGAARALRRRTTNMLAVVVADVENPFFTAVVRGVEDVALSAGHSVILCNTDEDPDRARRYVQMAVVERVAGVVVAMSGPARDLRPLLDAGIPVVAVDRVPVGAAVDAVVVDNAGGGRVAGEHLVAAGARRAACVTGPKGVPTADERARGFVAAFTDAGRTAPRVRRADFRAEGGGAAVAALLRAANRPDALFVANNLMTVGAVAAVREAGLHIPDDVRLVGFDDFPAASLMDPPLTVVSQPAREIGRRAARLLQLRAADPSRPVAEVVLPAELVVRGS